MSNSYFKAYTESHSGEEGYFYCEVHNGLIERQINVFNGIYYWATPQDCLDDDYYFTDQPEFGLSDDGAQMISSSEFDALWALAISQLRKGR